MIALAFALGVWASDVVIERLRIEDPGVIVWDEFVGQWIALLPLVIAPRGWSCIVLGFALFRVFDIWKPWPVSWADRRVKGGLGVMTSSRGSTRLPCSRSPRRCSCKAELLGSHSARTGVREQALFCKESRWMCFR